MFCASKKVDFCDVAIVLVDHDGRIVGNKGVAMASIFRQRARQRDESVVETVKDQFPVIPGLLQRDFEVLRYIIPFPTLVLN